MSVSTFEMIYMIVGLINFAGIFISQGVGLYFSFYKMDLMLGYLKHCPAVMNSTVLLSAGWRGRMYVLGQITSVLLYPKVYLRDGGVVASDIEGFPVNLKRKLILMHRIDGFLFWTLCGLGVVLYFKEYM